MYIAVFIGILIVAVFFLTVLTKSKTVSTICAIFFIMAFLFLMLVFPLLAHRVSDVEPTTTTEKYELQGIVRDDRVVYLAQTGGEFQFIILTEEEGLRLLTADLSDVKITYQGTSEAHLQADITTSKYHSQWLFLRDFSKTETIYKYHFCIPRNAVWYTYETN